jgi:hemoglobin/transferrin/lactoferrin receptor protein
MKLVMSSTLAFVAMIGMLQAQDEIALYDTLDQPVYIKASKFKESRREVPYQVESIGARKLSWVNAQTSADVLANTGNVMVQKSQGGGGSPIIRGFEANRVLLVVDGVRLNNAIFRGGHLQNVLRIDNSALERAELIFGPTSVLYGSDALGGVVHFYTKAAKLNDFSGNAYGRFSTANQEKTGHVDFNVGGGKLASFTSFTYSDFGDLVQGANRSDKYPNFGKLPVYPQRINGADVVVNNPNPNQQIGTAYHQYDLLEKILWQPNAHTSHIFNFQYSATGAVPRYDRRSELDNAGKPRFAEWDYGPEKRLLTSYRMENTKAGFLDRYTFTAAYQNAQESRITRRFNNVNRTSQLEDVDVFSADLDGIKKVGKHEFLLGVEAYFNQVDSRAFSTNLSTEVEKPAGTRYPDGGSQMNSYAAYVQDKITAGQWIFNLGARFNYITLNSTFKDRTFFPFPYNTANQNKSALTGTASAVYLPNDKTRWSVVLSSGFRAPNVDDLSKVFETVPGVLIVPNPAIEPEYTYNAEINFSQWFGDKLRLEAALYTTLFNNAIVLDAFQFNGQDSAVYNGLKSKVFANQNKRRALVNGFNAQVFLYPVKNLSIQATINATRGRIQAPKASPLDHIPPLFGMVSVNYNKNAFRTELWWMYSATKRIEDYLLNAEDNERYATPDGMPAWNTLNLRAGYQFGQTFNLQVALENILDQNYRVFASGVSGAGRNLRVTGRVSF